MSAEVTGASAPALIGNDGDVKLGCVFQLVLQLQESQVNDIKCNRIALSLVSMSIPDPCQLPDRFCTCAALNSDEEEARWPTL